MKKIVKSTGAVLTAVALFICQLFVMPVRAAGGTDLYVGYPSKQNNFSTVQQAVDKAAGIKPGSESDRVPSTLHRERTVSRSLSRHRTFPL